MSITSFETQDLPSSPHLVNESYKVWPPAISEIDHLRRGYYIFSSKKEVLANCLTRLQRLQISVSRIENCRAYEVLEMLLAVISFFALCALFVLAFIFLPFAEIEKVVSLQHQFYISLVWFISASCLETILSLMRRFTKPITDTLCKPENDPCIIDITDALSEIFVQKHMSQRQNFKVFLDNIIAAADTQLVGKYAIADCTYYGVFLRDKSHTVKEYYLKPK